MTWTYSGDPASTNRDAVRFKIGDTDTNNQQLSDEEIAYAISNNGQLDLAAADCCEAIAAKVAAKVPVKTVQGVSRALTDRMNYYLKLAKQLRTAGAYNCKIKVGGIDTSLYDDLDNDTTVRQPNFAIGQDEIPPRSGGWSDVGTGER